MNGLPDFDPTRSNAIREMLGDVVANTSQRRRTTNRVTLLVSLIIAALLLSGGGVALALTGRLPFTPAPTPTHSIAPTPTSTPTPLPTPTPTAPPAPPPIDLSDPSTWIIAEGSVGPLRLGGSMSGSASSMTAFTPDALPDGCPAAVYSASPSTQPPLTIALIPRVDAADAIDVIDISGNGTANPATNAGSPKTAQGIGLSSTVAELQAAYPGIVATIYKGIPVYSIQQSDGSWIDFEAGVFEESLGGAGHIESITVMNGPIPPYEWC